MGCHCLLWKVKSLSRVQLFVTPWTVAYEAPPSMGFSRQEYWSGLPLPSPGDLPDPGIEHGSPALQADALPSKPRGKPAPSGNLQNPRGGERRPRLEERPPETKTQEETAGSKSRKGRAGVGTQARAGPGLSCPRGKKTGWGRRLHPHVPLGPPRGAEAAAARGVPARRSLRPPRRGGSSGRTMHSGSVVRAAHRSLSGPFSPSFAGGAGDPDARRM